jgi:hypothetical protein
LDFRKTNGQGKNEGMIGEKEHFTCCIFAIFIVGSVYT